MNRFRFNAVWQISIPVFLSIFFFAQAGHAQDLKAHIDAKEVLVGHTFEVKYEFPDYVDGAFRPPAFKGLEVVEGMSRGNSVSIVNGRKTVKSTFSFTLAGMNPGIYTIRPAAVTYKGKKIFSKPLTIKVVSPGKQGKNQPTDDVFIQTVVLDTPAYPGSQVNVNYVLFTSVSIADVSIQKEDEYQAFIVRDIPIDENGTYQVVNGKQYLTQSIKHVALYPTQAGRVKVKPLVVQVEIPSGKRHTARSLIEQFFSSTQYQTAIIQSDGFDVLTHNFPAPIPNNFSGASGRLEMETSISEKNITTDDAVSLKVRLTGISNPTAIKAPILDLPDHLTSFPAKVIQDTIRSRDGQLAFSKTYEYLLQPDKAGKYHFKIKTSYFDVATQSYKELQSEDILLTVTQGSAVDLDETGEEANAKLSVSSKPFLWGILGLLVVLFGIFAWKRSHKDIFPDEPQTAPTQPLAEKTKAPSTAPSTTKKEDLPAPTPKKKGHFDITPGLTGKPLLREVLKETERYFEDQFNIPHAQFNKERLFKTLESQNLPPQAIHELKDWWMKVESALYANMPLPYDESKVLPEIKRIVSLL